MVQEKQYEGYYDYMLRRTRESTPTSEMNLLKRDMADLTKSYYDALKRNEELNDQVRKLESKILDMLPIYLDIDRNLSKSETVGYEVSLPNGEGSSEIGDSQPKKYHYNQSYFYLANETSYDCARITSHIKSAILHPMIFNAGRGTLKLFKSWGFKSFPNVFDESYDKIRNDKDRHEFIMDEVERICLLSDVEKNKLYVDSIPILS
mgnify:CR=1 FL=1